MMDEKKGTDAVSPISQDKPDTPVSKPGFEPTPSASSSALSSIASAPSEAGHAGFRPVSTIVQPSEELLLKQRSLKYSVADGSFYAVMTGFGESFFSAFALFLHATNAQLALLGSLPQMIGSYGQIITRRSILLMGSKKRFVVTAAILQALMHLFIFAAYFFGALSIPMLIGAVCLYFFFSMIIGPAWSTWMGDLVDERLRGTYFGRRNFVCGFASFVAFLTAGYVLQSFTTTIASKLVGFGIIFAIALVARLGSAYYLSRQYEPAVQIPKVNPFPLKSFLKAIRTTNFGTFVTFLWFFNFGVYLSSPFFTPYMLSELHLSYLQFTIINAAQIIATLLFNPVWGKASDRFGTRKLMFLSACLVCMVPILWVFSSSVTYLIIVQLFSGFAWAGLNLTTSNFFFDTTKPGERTSAIAYHNVINGTMLFLGAITGGWLVTIGYIPNFSVYLGVMLASGFVRILACIFILARVTEVRKFEYVGYRHLLLKELTVQPTLGLVHGAYEATSRTRRRVTALITDIDDFLEQIAGPRMNSFFVEIDDFFEKRILRKR